MSASSPPLNPGDPGGPGGGYQRNRKNGEYTDRLIPEFLDREGNAGQLQFLRMKAKTGAIPNNPFLLRLSVEKHVGGQIAGAFKENKGISYVLKVRSQAQFDKLLTMSRLADGTEISVEEHSNLNQVKCVVSNADTIGLEEGYIAEQLREQKVKEVRRIKRRNRNTNALEETPTLILTISGTVVPDHIDFGWSRCRTRNFYPNPMQCFRCWSFGHTGKRCTAPARVCGRCSKVHQEDQEMETANEQGTTNEPTPRRVCTEPTYCKACNSAQHALSSRECPAFRKENAIQIIRVDDGLSYPQARREFEAREAQKERDQGRNSYAGVASSSKDAEIAELRGTVKRLENEAAKREQRMADMEQALAYRPISERLETAKDHGPIEELIRQVAELTATVRQLQADLKEKDQIIAEMKEKQQVTPRNSMTTPTPIPQSSSPYTTVSSVECLPNFADPTMTAQVAEWVRNNVAAKKEKMANEKKRVVPKKQRKKSNDKQTAPLQDDQSPHMSHSPLSRIGKESEFLATNMELDDSDNSLKSVGTATSSAAGSKRIHSISSAESSINSADEVRITRNKTRLPRDTAADISMQ